MYLKMQWLKDGEEGQDLVEYGLLTTSSCGLPLSA